MEGHGTLYMVVVVAVDEEADPDAQEYTLILKKAVNAV